MVSATKRWRSVRSLSLSLSAPFPLRYAHHDRGQLADLSLPGLARLFVGPFLGLRSGETKGVSWTRWDECGRDRKLKVRPPFPDGNAPSRHGVFPRA